MGIKEAAILDIKRIAKSKFKVELTENEAGDVYEILSDGGRFESFYSKKLKAAISSHLDNAVINPLDSVYTVDEAATRWSISSSHLRNALNSTNRFDMPKQKGWVKKAGGTWIVTEHAMRHVFGSPENKEVVGKTVES